MRWRRPAIPGGTSPTATRPDASLSDAGAQPRSRFSGVALDNLYASGRQRIAAMPLEWTLGYQKLDWGNRFLVLGGLRDLNPIDIPALTRPGMLQREQETRIPVPQIFARLGVSPSTSIEGFYQFGFERNAPTQCGTFYSGVDWYSDGCNAVTVGAGSDRAALASGSYPQARRQRDARRWRPVRRRADAHGRCLGDQVRRVRHAVPFAHGLQRRDQVAAHRRGAVPSGRPRWPQSEVRHRIPRGHPHVRLDVRDPLRGRARPSAS